MHLTREHIDAYCLSLLADEHSAGTISKCRRDLTAFARWLDGRAVVPDFFTCRLHTLDKHGVMCPPHRARIF